MTDFFDGIDFVGAYAAALSTLIAVWEYKKWKNRHAVKLTCSPNQLFGPPFDGEVYVISTFVNMGVTPTTVTHYHGYHWPNKLDKLLNKNKTCFVITTCENIPALVNPGEEWRGKVPQQGMIEQMAKDGILYMGVNHSMDKKAVMQRIKIK